MKITETEMRGLITGKAMPADIFVGESLAAYLVRKFKSLHTERDELAAAHSELRESMAAIHNTIRLDGVNTSLGALLSASKRAHEASLPTDAYLNSVRAEGIHFAANRMLAAWERGFIDDTPAQVHDISGAVLSALEFLPNASPEEFKRNYADEVRSAIANQLRAGKDGE